MPTDSGSPELPNTTIDFGGVEMPVFEKNDQVFSTLDIHTADEYPDIMMQGWFTRSVMVAFVDQWQESACPPEAVSAHFSDLPEVLSVADDEFSRVVEQIDEVNAVIPHFWALQRTERKMNIRRTNCRDYLVKG